MRVSKFSAAIAFMLVVSQAGADPKRDAEAAMALAKAKLITLRDELKRVAQFECHAVLTEAKEEATRSKKQLVLWVGMTCESMPAIREGLSDCVHCHVDNYNGSTSPRICVPVDGGAWCFPRDRLGVDYDAGSVRAVIGKPIPQVLPIKLPVAQADCPNGLCPKK